MSVIAKYSYSYSAGQDRQVLFLRQPGYDVEARVYKLRCDHQRVRLIECLSSKKIYVSMNGDVCPLHDYLVDKQIEIIKESIKNRFISFSIGEKEVEKITVYST